MHSSQQTAGEGLARRHAAQWRQKAAGHSSEDVLDAGGRSLSHGAILAKAATAAGRQELERRREWAETRRQAQRCCCWEYLVTYPMKLFVACGAGIYRRWLLPPLAWLCTLLLRVLSMIMDAFSMLFMQVHTRDRRLLVIPRPLFSDRLPVTSRALEEDLRYAEQNRNHADRHISHALAQLQERHFHGKSVAITSTGQLWIVLFYSPRSKLGGNKKIEALKEELQGLSLSKLIDRAELAQVEASELAPAQEFRDAHTFICPWKSNTVPTDLFENGEDAVEEEGKLEEKLKKNVINYIVRASQFTRNPPAVRCDSDRLLTARLGF